MAWPFSVFPLACFNCPLAWSTCAFTSGSQLTGKLGSWYLTSHATTWLVWSSLQSAESVKESLSKYGVFCQSNCTRYGADVTEGGCCMNSGVFGWFRTMMVGALVDGSSPRTEPRLLHHAQVTADVCLVPCVTPGAVLWSMAAVLVPSRICYTALGSLPTSVWYSASRSSACHLPGVTCCLFFYFWPTPRYYHKL